MFYLYFLWAVILIPVILFDGVLKVGLAVLIGYSVPTTGLILLYVTVIMISMSILRSTERLVEK